MNKYKNNMGFFSWLTNDTKTSISNVSSSKPLVTVYLVNNNGKFWMEKSYLGYGEFGGKDFFELFKDMNGLASRNKAIELYHQNDDDTLIYPNLVTKVENWNWINEKPKNCPNQGYFYDFHIIFDNGSE